MKGHILVTMPVMSILPLFDLKALVLLDLSFTADATLDAFRLGTKTASVAILLLIAFFLLSVMTSAIRAIESALALEIALRLLLFLFFSAFSWISACTERPSPALVQLDALSFLASKLRDGARGSGVGHVSILLIDGR